MTLYGLLRRLLPGLFANITYVLFCAISIILVLMFWPATTQIFAYLKL